MASFNSNLVMFMSLVVTSMQFHGTAAQTTHVVGDSLGWTIPSGDLAAYTTWASRQTFTVGDILVFNFNNGVHDVAEVSATSYDPCNATNPMSLATTGPATITLTTAGSHYYICTFTSHCQIGQKLSINVSTAGTTTPPSTTPATPPTTTAIPPMIRPMTPATPDAPCPPTSSPNSNPSSPPPTITYGNTGTPPPPGSGAPTFTVMAPITFLAAAVAFLNY